MPRRRMASVVALSMIGSPPDCEGDNRDKKGVEMGPRFTLFIALALVILTALLALSCVPLRAQDLQRKEEYQEQQRQRQFPQIGRSLEKGLDALRRSSPYGHIFDPMRAREKTINPVPRVINPKREHEGKEDPR